MIFQHRGSRILNAANRAVCHLNPWKLSKFSYQLMSEKEKHPQNEDRRVPRGIVQAFLGLVYFGTYLTIANSVNPQATLIEFLKVHSSAAQVISAAGVLATEVLQWAFKELKRWFSRRIMMWLFQASGEDPLKELRQLRKQSKELEELRERNKELKALHERYSQWEREKAALETENASLRQRNTELENGKAAAADTSDSADG